MNCSSRFGPFFRQMAKKNLVCGKTQGFLTYRLMLPDEGPNSDRIQTIFCINGQKLDFTPVRSVETQEHILAWMACCFLTYSGDALAGNVRTDFIAYSRNVKLIELCGSDQSRSIKITAWGSASQG